MAICKWLLACVCWSFAFAATSCTKASSKESAIAEKGIAVPAPDEDSGGLLTASEPVEAQIKVPGAKEATVKTPGALSRTDQIWEAVNDRVSGQIDVWFNAGDFPKAIELLQFQQQMLPADYDIATNLGWMFENVEDYDSALKIYVRYMEQNPKDPDNRLPQADMYFRTKKYAEVIRVLQPVIDRKGLHANNYRQLALSYERVKEFEKSVKVWQQYLAVKPGDGAAKKNLERVQGKMKGKA